uniref:Uncharacterized protein n=1 Tax=Sphenodon punctatus TaxID=8508 RepID=A0A8D0GX39_SPHPU
MSSIQVAVVTGSNKGIGLAIVRALCKKFSGDVYLTARDTGRGQAAVAKLQEEGLKPLFHQLDINDLQSIQTLRDFLKEKYGGLNVLVNNAGIAFKVDDPTPFHIQAEETLKTNFFATKDICNELLPLIKPLGKLIMLCFLEHHPSPFVCVKRALVIKHCLVLCSAVFCINPFPFILCCILLILLLL